jgi:hypothetical protein
LLIVAAFTITKQPTDHVTATDVEHSDDAVQTFKCKCFNYQAQTLVGFTAKKLVDLETREAYGEIDAMFAKVDYTTIWNLVVKIEEETFNKKKFIEATLVSCKK